MFYISYIIIVISVGKKIQNDNIQTCCLTHEYICNDVSVGSSKKETQLLHTY